MNRLGTHVTLDGASVTPLRLSNRARAFASRFSIRTKIIGIVLTLTTILGLGITWQVRDAMSGLAQSELSRRGEAIVLEIASDIAGPLGNENVAVVTDILESAMASHPDASFAVVSRPDGVVIATAADANVLPAGVPDDALSGQPGQIDGFVSFSSAVSDDSGSIALGMSEEQLVRAVNGVTLQLLLTTLFVGAIGIAAATTLTWLLTRPILDLVEATTRVSRGDLSARATVTSDDEIGLLGNAFNSLVNELESNRAVIAETEEARTHLVEQLIVAQEDERKRIARELHDGVGQSLSSIMLMASMIERSETSDGNGKYAAEIREASSETLKDVRRLGRELRPSVLDDLGLTAALVRYAAEFQLQYPEIMTEFHADLPKRLSPVVETTMYRVIQEGMTNVARHSGAKALSVIVTDRAGGVRAIIEDDGSGFDAETERRNGHSVGIHGMIERIDLLGGRLEIESSDTGTSIYAEVPAPTMRTGT